MKERFEKMTLQEACEYGRTQLEQAEIEDAAIDAWYLLEFVTGISRTEYFLNPKKELEKEQRIQYEQVIKKRAEHVPLQHITGVQEFMGLEFQVNEQVLVPRQDTEILVECVLEGLKPNMHVLDMCTGSGCILISLMKFTEHLCGHISGTGVDISEDALAVARENAKKHQVDATWIQSDLFKKFEELEELKKLEGKYDVIVSNPPYICTHEIEALKEEVKFHDPLLALDGKEDGLYFYRKIIAKSPKYLQADGKLYFEIGYEQGDAVKQLMEEQGFTEVVVKKDLAGLDRVVFGRCAKL